MNEEMFIQNEENIENLEAIKKIIESTQPSPAKEDFKEIPIGTPIKKDIETEDKKDLEVTPEKSIKSEEFIEIPIGTTTEDKKDMEVTPEESVSSEEIIKIPIDTLTEKLVETENKLKNEIKTNTSTQTKQSKPKASDELKMEFLNSFDIFSEGTRQLFEMRSEEFRLKNHICEMISKIINYANISIPIDPEVLKAPEFDVAKASMGYEGIIHITLENGDETFERITNLNAKGILKLLNDMVPKFKLAIEQELKTLNNNVNQLNKAASELKKAEPPDQKEEEEGVIDIVRENLDIK